MQFICLITASYTLGLLMTKNPLLVFRMKHESSKQKLFVFSFMEKNRCHTISFVEKMLILLFSYTYFCSMKLYERV